MLLDARPDRIDFRDRNFRPQLRSLPRAYPAEHRIGLFLRRYIQEGMVLDQGTEGACTGYGLAAVINYLTWLRKTQESGQGSNIVSAADLPPPDEKVSERMLYNAARLYDEWEGEDYSGSSCRGAMKGWHKHGVCKQQFWPEAGLSSIDDQGEWARNAARLPLGAYYRLDVQSISDMQAAVHEVGAVYCSAKVHSGWFFQEHTTKPETKPYEVNINPQVKEQLLPIIPISGEYRGGHAFAIIGYNTRGFIVQNSWGNSWAKAWGSQAQPIENAFGAFAILTYEDWVINAHDAWVATLAAPMLVGENFKVPKTRSDNSLIAHVAQSQAQQHLSSKAVSNETKRWSNGKAKRHCIVMGNDGKLTTERIDADNARHGLRRSMQELLDKHANQGGKDVMIFAHGGLNKKEDAFRRAQILGPWLESNNILPIFIVWRTGFGESLVNIGKDFINSQFSNLQAAEQSGIESIFSNFADELKKRTDRGFEVFAEKVMGKAVWSQIKQNALAANRQDLQNGITGGMRELADFLRDYQKKSDKQLNLHLLGHSAGSIILGHFAQDIARFMNIASFGLLAPACTLKFANAVFPPLVESGRLDANRFFIANLSRENERADHVGPYNKSLLYLVSRAFETPHKMPLLGLDDSWILDCELDENGTSFPHVSDQFKNEDDPLHQAMVLAKLAPYYALTGRKALSEYGDRALFETLAATKNLNNTDHLRKICKDLKLSRIAKKDGVLDILKWRNFKAETNFPYLLHTQTNANVKRTEARRKKFEPISHGNIDNDIYVMNWAIAQMISGKIVPATDLSER